MFQAEIFLHPFHTDFFDTFALKFHDFSTNVKNKQFQAQFKSYKTLAMVPEQKGDKSGVLSTHHDEAFAAASKTFPGSGWSLVHLLPSLLLVVIVQGQGR